jgi:hypothetical protein
MFCIAANSQYASANKKVEDDYGKLEALVGKEFWIKTNPNVPNVMRKKFVSSIKNWDDRKDEFVMTKDTKFLVTGWDKSEIKLDYLKIQFEDGKEAYFGLGVLWVTRSEILPDVFDGSEFNEFTDYFFKELPAVAIEKFKAKKAKQAAEYKAKGGVKIGMTKEEVLKSNWGKPESINKTTTTTGTREQWIYGGRKYLYFTNGILTGIQN